MYDAFLQEKGLIPERRFAEVGFEDLEGDPIGQLKGIYERLGLDGFGSVQPILTRYLESIAGFKKSALPEVEPAVRERIVKEWGPFFAEWGYSM